MRCRTHTMQCKKTHNLNQFDNRKAFDEYIPLFDCLQNLEIMIINVSKDICILESFNTNISNQLFSTQKPVLNYVSKISGIQK